MRFAESAYFKCLTKSVSSHNDILLVDESPKVANLPGNLFEIKIVSLFLILSENVNLRTHFLSWACRAIIWKV